MMKSIAWLLTAFVAIVFVDEARGLMHNGDAAHARLQSNQKSAHKAWLKHTRPTHQHHEHAHKEYGRLRERIDGHMEQTGGAWAGRIPEHLLGHFLASQDKLDTDL